MDNLKTKLDVLHLQLTNIEAEIGKNHLSDDKKELLQSIVVDMKRQAKTLKHIITR